jgi:ArsR family transcriptional regulator
LIVGTANVTFLLICKNILTDFYVLNIIHRERSIRGEVMDDKYIEYAQFFKVLSDPNRLMIIDMLSCGELCACVILEKFNITQPTLSYHMKSLCDSGLVVGRKEGKWMYYSLSEKTVQTCRSILTELTSYKDNCICIKTDCCEVKCV